MTKSSTELIFLSYEVCIVGTIVGSRAPRGEGDITHVITFDQYGGFLVLLPTTCEKNKRAQSELCDARKRGEFVFFPLRVLLVVFTKNSPITSDSRSF
jgi:hypothetical protein